MTLAPAVSPLGDLVDRHADDDRIALVMPGVRLSYRELAECSDRFAASLLGIGVQAGDHVGILMHNCLDFVLALLAIAKVNAVAVPINGRFKDSEAGYVLGHSDLTVLLTGSDPRGTDYPHLVHRVLTAAEDDGDVVSTTLRHVVDFSDSVPGFLTRADFDAAGASIDAAEVKARQSTVRVRDIALLMYTSGTTARPKGCLLTHEAIARHGENVQRSRFDLTRDDAFWDPLPLFHCGGIVPMFGCFAIGAKYCHAGHFDPAEAVRTIEAERCTVLYPAFEAIWLPILTHPDLEKADFSHVRVIQNIATPERMMQFEEQMPWAPQVTSYGATETASNLTLGHPNDPLEVRVATLGRPVPGMEYKVVDPVTGLCVAPGEFGELCFRGYACFEGYYKAPEATAAAFDAEGYFHTGDRVAVRDDGNLLYGGRYKDMLKVGGENVASIEIEDHLVTLPAVGVVQVVGVRDARYGEVPAAFIELAPGASIDEHEVIARCVGAIATYKVPRYVRFVTEWPMSGTKVKKYELRQRLEAELDAAGISEAARPPAPERTVG